MRRVLGLFADSAQCDGQPAFVLGHRYEFQHCEFSSEFLADCASCVWMMYRTRLQTPIPRHPDGPSPLLMNIGAMLRAPSSAQAASLDNSSFTSDVGWGCMVRTAQSLLANALLTLENCRTTTISKRAVEILRMFNDTPQSQFSVHRFVAHASERCGTLPGQWFGPSTAAQCIQFLLGSSTLANSLNCYLSAGSDVYTEHLTAFPVIVLCGLRLGIDNVAKQYETGITHMLKSEHCVGIAGGRPGASLYFYGCEGDRLFFHDPHISRQSIDDETSATELWEATHSTKINALSCSELDPSMLAGFLLKSKQDLSDWTQHMQQLPENARVLQISASAPEIPNVEIDFPTDAEDGECVLSAADN